MNLGPLILLAMAQLPPSPDPMPIAVAGVVLDASGSTVSGADVWLAEAIAPDAGRRSGPELLGPVAARPASGSPPDLARVRTDASGQFTIDIPAEILARPSPPPMAIWASIAGKDARVACHLLPRIVLTDEPPVRIELGGAAHLEMTVLGPDRKPVAGARVIPARAGEVQIPEPLGYSLAATTDADGRAVLAGLAPAAIGVIRVDTTAFGTQTLEFFDRAGIVAMAPVGRVAGRLVVPGDEPIRSVTVHARSQVGGHVGSGQGGSAVVACDEQGRFEIPAIAAGMLTLALEFDPERGTTLRSWPISRIPVRSGRTTEVAIPLHPTVKVRGLVRERKTGLPIAGVTVLWNGVFDGRNASVSDASGIFRGFVQREEILAMPFPIRVPSPYLPVGDWFDARKDLPPRGVDEQALAPAELARGVEVGGTVVDDRGQPVAGASLEAIRPTESAIVHLTRSDRSGRFMLHGVDPREELILTAWDGLASTASVAVGPQSFVARPITLTVSPGNTAPVGGRVVDTAGKPIAGASVRIWREVRMRGGRVVVVDPIAAGNGSAMVRTDAHGRYRTLRRFPAHCGYFVEASAPGRFPARSPVITPSQRAGELPPVVLRRLRTIAGQVVDRQGRPVAGALVFQSGDGPMPTETLTADDGRFHLPGVLEGAALVFARKDGFRLGFAGCSESTGDGDPPPVTVTLMRAGEPPVVVYKALAPILPPEDEKALAHRLIEPLAAEVLARGTDQEKYQFLMDLAGFDPAGALDRLEAARLADADSVQITAASAIARESLDEAMTIVEGYPTADVRALAYMAIGDASPDLEPARARTLIDQVIVNARASKRPNIRLYLLLRIVARLIDFGEIDRARALTREGQELARAALRDQSRARQLAGFAGVWVRHDPAKELAAFEDLKRQVEGGKVTVRAFAFDRYYAQAAHAFATRDPAEAEKLARLMSFTLPRPANEFVMAVCVRMAPVNLARARKLVELITDDERALRPYALGRMAGAVAASDKAAANRLLDEAYAELDRLAAEGWTSQFASICGVAGALLPVVEQVDAARLPEFLPRALVLRPPTGGRNDSADVPERTASLAMMVARYDRALAARILQPELEGLGAAPSPTAPLSYMVFDHETGKRVLAALVLIDSREGVARIERLPDEAGIHSLKNEARLEAARILALQGEARWSHVCERELLLWTPRQGIQ